MVENKRKKKDPINITVSVLTFVCIVLFITAIFFYWKSIPQFVNPYDIFYPDPYKRSITIDQKWESYFFYAMSLLLVLSLVTLILKSFRHKRPSDHYPVTAVVLFILSIVIIYLNVRD